MVLLKTVPAHDSSPPPPKKYLVCLTSSKQLDVSVFPQNFLPAHTNICILIYSMWSYQKPCFATCFFQSNSKSWASFFIALLYPRGAWYTSTCKYHCWLSQFLLIDVWLFPVFAITNGAAGSTLTHCLTQFWLNLWRWWCRVKGYKYQSINGTDKFTFSVGWGKERNSPFHVLLLLLGRGRVRDSDNTFLRTKKLWIQLNIFG